jgi:hypothetical protein
MSASSFFKASTLMSTVEVLTLAAEAVLLQDTDTAELLSTSETTATELATDAVLDLFTPMSASSFFKSSTLMSTVEVLTLAAEAVLLLDTDNVDLLLLSTSETTATELATDAVLDLLTPMSASSFFKASTLMSTVEVLTLAAEAVLLLDTDNVDLLLLSTSETTAAELSTEVIVELFMPTSASSFFKASTSMSTVGVHELTTDGLHISAAETDGQALVTLLLEVVTIPSGSVRDSGGLFFTL